MSSLRVAVIGAYGRMGSTTCDAIDADPDLDLVARIGEDDRLDAVVAAGIARVVIGCDDPTEKASGRGPGTLRDEGLEVQFVDGAEAAAAGTTARISATSGFAGGGS